MKFSKIIVAGAAATLCVTPALGGNSLISPATDVKVAKSTLNVDPAHSWNKMGARPGRNSETWTIDGPELNDVTFYGGIADGGTLFREVDKKNRPLPKFSATMLPHDIAQTFETSYRIANGTSLMSIDGVEPTQFANHSGFRFSYTFTSGDEVKRKGEAHGAVIKGKLYLMTYEAPHIFYFDRDVAKYHQLVSTAAIT